MVKLPVDVSFKQVTQKEFCEAVVNGINAIGHKGTVDLVNTLCSSKITVNRATIEASIGDTIFIIMLNFRLEEGKVLGSEEVQQMYNKGKVMLLKAKIHNSVLEELAQCYKKCDEMEYDHLASLAKGES